MDNVDICMAVFNGCEFLEKQLNSIISNGHGFARLNFVVVDDSSDDKSVDLLRLFFKKHSNYANNIYQNPLNIGYVQNFAKAISLTNSCTIMLSDQDDIWPVNRIHFLNTALDSSKRELVIGNFSVLETTDPKFHPSSHNLTHKGMRRFRKVTLFDYIFSSIPLYGCCFAFKDSLKKYILPIPSIVDSHDRWIALISILRGSCFYSDTVVTVRGLHHANETRSLPLLSKGVSFSIKLISIFYALARVLYVDLSGYCNKFLD